MVIDVNEIKYLILDNSNEDILSIRKEVFIIEQQVPKDIEYEINENERIHCCLYLGNELIAYGRIVLPYEHARKALNIKCVRVGRVCVRKKYRYQGYGRKIMNFIESNLKKWGISKIEVHAQLQAKEFYLSLGYLINGDIFSEAGIEHIEMYKIL